VVGLHQASLDLTEQQRAIDAIVAAIEATGRFDALPLTEVASTIAGRESVIVEEGLLADARQDLATGKSAYNQAATEDAIVALESAIERLLGVFAATNDTTDLWEAYVTLGSAHLQGDPPDDVAARLAFTEAVALAPSRPLNPALYPPNVVELFGQVQGQVATSGHTVEIVADGASTIWLDGVLKGPSPQSVTGVPPGMHHALARGTNTQGYVRFELRPPTPAPPDPASTGTAQTIQVQLGPVGLGDAAASAVGRSNQIASLYQALGNRADGLDYVLIAGVSDSLLVLQLLSTGSDTFSKAMELPYTDDADDEAAQAIPLLLGGIDSTGGFVSVAPVPGPLDLSSNAALASLLTTQVSAVPVGGLVPETGDDDDDDGKGKKSKVPLVLGIVGGSLLIAGGGAGAYFLTEGSGEPNQGAVIIQF
jgi:hypothetical protein